MKVNPMSAVLVAIFFAFAMWSTQKSYRKEKDPARKRQILVQLVLALSLIILVTVGVLFMFPPQG